MTLSREKVILLIAIGGIVIGLALTTWSVTQTVAEQAAVVRMLQAGGYMLV